MTHCPCFRCQVEAFFAKHPLVLILIVGLAVVAMVRDAGGLRR